LGFSGEFEKIVWVYKREHGVLPYDDCKIDIQIRSRLAINMAIMLQKNSTNSVGEHSVRPLLIQTN
jgi:hypothetical protein